MDEPSTSDTGPGDAGTSTATGPGSSGGDDSSTGGDDSSTGDGSSDETSSSGGAVRSCGDGIVQPPEACDDGNETHGDGCSACAVSGTELWTITYAGESVDPFATEVDQADGVVLVGAEAGEMALQGFVQRYAADGAPAGATTIPSPGPWVYAVGRGTCAGTEDRIYVAGNFDDVQGESDTRHLRAYDGVDLVWTHDSTPGYQELWSDCVVVDDGPVVVGVDFPDELGTRRGIATAFDADGNESWSYVREDETIVGVARGPAGEIVVLSGGTAMTIVWLAADGTELTTREFPLFVPSRIAIDDDGSLHVLARNAVTMQPRLYALDADGEVLWMDDPFLRLGAVDPSTQLVALAVGPGGETILGGTLAEDTPHRPWIAVYSSDGTPLSSGDVDMPLSKGSVGAVRDLDVDGEGSLVIAVAAYDVARAENVALVRKQVI